MKLYIAGPMTGIENLNFPAFHREAAYFRGQGHEVVNPAEINTDPHAQWHICMRADIREMVTCDSIAMLPGWEKSKGARIEHRLAQDLEIKVIYLVREAVPA